jgi:hypothetical protein
MKREPTFLNFLRIMFYYNWTWPQLCRQFWITIRPKIAWVIGLAFVVAAEYARAHWFHAMH